MTADEAAANAASRAAQAGQCQWHGYSDHQRATDQLNWGNPQPAIDPLARIEAKLDRILVELEQLRRNPR